MAFDRVDSPFARRFWGMTTREVIAFAEQNGISYQTMRRIICGVDGTRRYVTLQSVAKSLGITVEQLHDEIWPKD